MSDSKVTFRALQIANEQRTTYGLRYNDFERYRKHCANRTHRLRSTLKVTHGKGREFKKVPSVTPDSAKDGHLQLLLLEAERAWAYSQDLTAQALLPANVAKASTLRHSATGRFRRAVHWATQLLSLSQSLHTSGRLSAENLVEVTIYTLTLNGRFLRYRDEFEDALVQLSVARGLLQKLADSASTSRNQALAILFSDEVGPEIRYCAHELGHKEAYNVAAIAAQVSAKHNNKIVENYDVLLQGLNSEGSSVVESKARLTERLWEGEPVPVRYPELVDALLKVEVAEASLDNVHRDHRGKKSKLGVTAYDSTLLALSDAEDVARKLEEAQQVGSSSVANQGRDIHFVRAYIAYQLSSRRVQRDLLLIATLIHSDSNERSAGQSSGNKNKGKTKAVDARLYPALVKLLDTVLQGLNQMRTLSIVDDNPDLAAAVEGRLAFTNARRAAYLAQCYGAVKKYAEALVLLDRAANYIRETLTNISILGEDLINHGNPPFFPLSKTDVDDLEASIAEERLSCQKDWFAYNGGKVDADPSSHKKPLFFNIALNYVELDVNRLRERAGKQPIPTATTATIPEAAVEKKLAVPKAKAEEIRPPTPEPQPAPRSGLSSLLGGWWSRS